MRLADGTVLPDYLGTIDESTSNMGDLGFFGEVTILAGEVTAMFPPNHPGNTNKQFVEYSVNVWRRSRNSVQERLAFRCFQADSFGSIADLMRFSLRPSDNIQQNSSLGNGATVLIACINGDRSNAYIIGAIPQPNRKEKDPTDKRWMRSRFNGVSFNINDDGSLEVTVPGATATDGTPDPKRDSNNHGSKMTFAANGDISLDDQTGNKVVISPSDNSVTVTANTAKVKAKTVEVEGDTVNVTSGDVNLGDKGLGPLDGVVLGSAIDPFTGQTFFALQGTSSKVKASK